MSDEVLTLDEYAEKYGVKRKTVQKWAREHKIPEAFKTPGGQWRIRIGKEIRWWERELPPEIPRREDGL